MRFTAIHRALGAAPGSLSEDMLDQAIELRLEESDDVDFKSQLPEAKRLFTDDFAKDVAAMANGRGGLIIYGVKEDAKAAVERVPAGEWSENYERSMRQAAQSRIGPPIDIQIAAFSQGHLAVVVYVPPSTNAPHFVFRDHWLAAPKRVNADTHWLKEWEIEAMYRQRLDTRRRALADLESMFDGVAAGRDVSRRAWLVAAATPQLPTKSERPSFTEVVQDFDKAATIARRALLQAAPTPLDETDAYAPRPGYRSWVAHSRTSSRRPWEVSAAALHTDGAVTLVSSAGGRPLRSPYSDKQTPGHIVPSGCVEGFVAAFLALARVNAQKLGGGLFDARISILWEGQDLLTIAQENFNWCNLEDSHATQRFVPVYVTLEPETTEESFLEQVRDLATDCLNQGGIETPHFIRSPGTGSSTGR